MSAGIRMRPRSKLVLIVVLFLSVDWFVWRFALGGRSNEEHVAAAGVAEAQRQTSSAELQLASNPAVREEVGEGGGRAAPQTPAVAVESGGAATLIVQLLAKETGAPLAGLEVSVSEQRAGQDPGSIESSGLTDATDAQGRLTLSERAGEALEIDIEPTEPSLAAKAHLEVPALAPHERREVVVTLATRLDLVWFARILDGTSQASLAGVRAGRVQESPFGESLGEASVSASDGIVSLVFHSWRPSYARVEREGYATAFVKLDSGHEQPSTACVVSLARAAALEAYLTAPDGAPCAELSLRVVPEALGRVQGDLDIALNELEPPFEGFTDARGRCVLENLPPGRALTIDVLENGQLLRHEERALHLEPGERRELRWTVGAPCTLVGLTLEADGSPARQVPVRLVPDNGLRLLRNFGEATAETRSDGEGRFTLEVGAGAWRVGPAPEEDAWPSKKDRSNEIAPASERVVIAPGQTSAEVTLTCWRGLFLSGTVRGLEGELALSGMVDVQGEHVYIGTSFSKGAFWAGPFPPGSYQVSASCDGPDGRLYSEPRTAEAGTVGIELVLRRSSGLTVHVLDARGKPVEGAKVWLLSGKEYGNRIWTNASGEAPFENLPRVAYSLSATSPAGEFALKRGVTLAAGIGQRKIELRLAPAPHLRVEVLHAPEEDMQPLILLDGEPLALMFLDEGPEIPLAPGKYEIALWGSQGEVQRKRVRVAAEGETRVVFDLAVPR